MTFELKEPLANYYSKLKINIKNADIQSFKEFDKHNLSDPATWLKALATLESALDSCAETPETTDFFLLIFRGYDVNASVRLNEKDYDWYWNKIHEIFDRFGPVNPGAWFEKGMQYFTSRRDYRDNEKTYFFLKKSVENGYDTAYGTLGFYTYYGFCCEKDREKGMEILNSAKTERGKIRCALYKNIIASNEGNPEALAMFEELEKTEVDTSSTSMIYEQHAYMLEQEGKHDEALKYYQKALEITPSSSYSLMRQAFIYYNKQIDQRKAIDMMEQAFYFGQFSVVRSLHYCYFNSGAEWQDNDRALFWLEKGFLYNDMFSTAELAYTLIYNEDYKDVERGLKCLDMAIEMGDTEAMISKSYIYFSGNVQEKDITKCLELLERAKAAGNANAGFRIGYMYEAGDATEDGEPDYEKAMSYFTVAAEMGDPRANGYAGRYYLVGLSVEPDAEKAKAYYEKGIELGDAYSMVELAMMYEEANGVEQNYEKAFELMKQATEQNYTHAWYMLGQYYHYSIGTDENPDEAIVCYEKAIEEGHVKATAELGLCYERGYGVEESTKKALELMLKAADNNYGYAQYKAGYYYMYGTDDIPEDMEKGVELFEKAIENGYPYAAIEMGNYYLYDYADLEEPEKSFSYFQQAANEDCVSEGLGICYEHGYGTEVNDAEAFKYYLKAAEDGYVRGMYNAGRCYRFGIGVKENYTEAFRWFNDASAHEFPNALYYKGIMLLAGEGCPQDINEGITALQLAASEYDNGSAQFELGNCYLVGKGVEENEELAMEWFEKAADNGHEQAMKITGRRKQ